jgi:predicted aconitase
MQGLTCTTATPIIITLSRATHQQAKDEGLLSVLQAAGVRIVQDLCWCSISEPVFPPEAKNLMTNSGKYAHYAPGLSGRTVRFGSLADCVTAAEMGHMPPDLPDWLRA